MSQATKIGLTILYGSACATVAVAACAWAIDGGTVQLAQGFGGVALIVVVGALWLGGEVRR